jgi:hypothetical protein
MATMQLVFRAAGTGQTTSAGDGAKPGPRGEVVVIHTNTQDTPHALKTSAMLAAGRAARIRLLVPQVVPYPLPIDHPPVPVNFIEDSLRSLLLDLAIETCIDVRLCRDLSVVLKTALPPVSVVVVGGRRRWWPTRQSRLVGRLRRQGHQVVFSTFS